MAYLQHFCNNHSTFFNKLLSNDEINESEGNSDSILKILQILLLDSKPGKDFDIYQMGFIACVILYTVLFFILIEKMSAGIEKISLSQVQLGIK